MLPLLILFGVAVVVFAFLLRGRLSPATSRAAEIAVAGLASINVTAVIGFGWLVIETLNFDGVMVLEMLGCVILMAILAGIASGGLALKRRGKTKTSVVLLAVTAVPMLVVYGFLVYLEFNPIDWR